MMAGELIEIRRRYNEHASHYDRWESIAEWLGVASLRRGLFGRARGRVLEVAVGSGKNFPYYSPAVESVVGVDLSEAMLQVARVRGRTSSFGVDLVQADATHLPFADGAFDTVTSSLSTCTFPDAVGALREMGRVVRPGGEILLLEHGRSSRPWLARFQDRRAEAHAQLLGCRWNREPERLVTEAGLKTTSSKKTFAGIFASLVAVPR